MALSTIASKLAHGTKNTMQKMKQLLDYLATHLDKTVQFHALDMILNIHSNALYLSKANTQQSMRVFLHGIETQSHTANQIEWGIFYLVCTILQFVVVFAA